MAEARQNDPETSHEAAGRITPEDATKVQRAVLAILQEHPAITDKRLIHYYHLEGYWGAFPATDQSIRSRRAELRDAGLVRHVGYSQVAGHRERRWAADGDAITPTASIKRGSLASRQVATLRRLVTQADERGLTTVPLDVLRKIVEAKK